MLRTFDYGCPRCAIRECRLVDSLAADAQVCTECKQPMIRLYSLPHIRTHKLSASYVDGQRGNSKAFQELRRQSYLEDVAFDATDRTEKAEAEKELAAITKKGNTNE